ncbi:hypothetical protein BJY00DRAFT_8207 [Aspergillus carlsbadensis]|nr:hypothetical protein BJY00DRAFT_8207 [Aspergillus carlsbadensis]
MPKSGGDPHSHFHTLTGLHSPSCRDRTREVRRIETVCKFDVGSDTFVCSRDGEDCELMVVVIPIVIVWCQVRRFCQSLGSLRLCGVRSGKLGWGAMVQHSPKVEPHESCSVSDRLLKLTLLSRSLKSSSTKCMTQRSNFSPNLQARRDNYTLRAKGLILSQRLDSHEKSVWTIGL